MKLIFILLLINIYGAYSRVPPRDQRETEETSASASAIDNKAPKDDAPLATPVERSPIDSDQLGSSPNQQPNFQTRKPIGVILFRQQPTFSLFSNRSPNPFMMAPWNSPMDHSHHFNSFHNGDMQNDPAIRLISLLLGDRRLRPILPESDAEATNTSSESSSAESTENNRKELHPFESLFPNIFPRFPLDDETEKEGAASEEDKTPANFENKEKKVVNINGRKFVKTTQVKKVKNDFGQFHSVISSYEPFDEKKHDENGNEKVKPDDDKITSNVDKKDVAESSTAATEKVDSSTPLDDKVDGKVSSIDNGSSPTPSTEKEEPTETPKDIKPDLKPVDLSTVEQKEPAEKMKISSENLNKEQDESKNEIPDKNSEIKEIKVDQMN